MKLKKIGDSIVEFEDVVYFKRSASGVKLWIHVRVETQGRSIVRRVRVHKYHHNSYFAF